MLKEIIVKTKQLLSDAIGENTDLGYYRIQKIIKGKNVKINGARVGTDMNVYAGDVVYVYYSDRERDSIEVVYRDENILVVNKSVGVEVQGENSLTSRINDILIDETAAPVHRLDRNTMGLVVFALNKTAENELLASFKDREIDKTYNCIVVGKPKQPKSKHKAFLFKDAKKSMVYISDNQKQGYSPIETHVTLLKSFDELSLLEVKLVTGRTHQIRAHLAHLKMPILGDGKYGINKINRRYRAKTQLLCCTKITFHFAQGALKYLDGKSVVLNVDLTQYYKK
ncbi:MAG: RluA family pseudouridine synthase [Clostridia bacterium]|nr:RluA family pseudouridine synthase [Clostridia bacterium]